MFIRSQHGLLAARLSKTQAEKCLVIELLVFSAQPTGRLSESEEKRLKNGRLAIGVLGPVSQCGHLKAIDERSDSCSYDILSFPKQPSGQAFASEAGDPRIVPCFLSSSRNSDFKMCRLQLVVCLPRARRYRYRAGIGWPCVSSLWLSEIAILTATSSLSVVARTIVSADESLQTLWLLLAGHRKRYLLLTCLDYTLLIGRWYEV